MPPPPRRETPEAPSGSMSGGGVGLGVHSVGGGNGVVPLGRGARRASIFDRIADVVFNEEQREQNPVDAVAVRSVRAFMWMYPATNLYRNTARLFESLDCFVLITRGYALGKVGSYLGGRGGTWAYLPNPKPYTLLSSDLPYSPRVRNLFKPIAVHCILCVL